MPTVYKILKYPISIVQHQTISIPTNAASLTPRFFKLMVQNGIPCIWVYVREPDKNKKEYEFLIIDTGEEIVNKGRYTYLDSFQIPAKGYVGHVFWAKV